MRRCARWCAARASVKSRHASSWPGQEKPRDYGMVGERVEPSSCTRGCPARPHAYSARVTPRSTAEPTQNNAPEVSSRRPAARGNASSSSRCAALRHSRRSKTDERATRFGRKRFSVSHRPGNFQPPLIDFRDVSVPVNHFRESQANFLIQRIRGPRTSQFFRGAQTEVNAVRIRTGLFGHS